MNRRKLLGGIIGGWFLSTVANGIMALFPELGYSKNRSFRNNHNRPVKNRLVPVVHASDNFVILQPGEPRPSSTVPPEYFMPRICGVVGSDENIPLAISVEASTTQILATNCGFPIYEIDDVPPGLINSGGISIEDSFGRVYQGALNYSICTSPNDCYAMICLIAEAYFYQPHSLILPDEEGDGMKEISAVNYLPTEGYLVNTGDSYMLHWVEDGIMYTVAATSSDLLSPQALAAKLVKVQ
jgi:hypothetical protein